MAEALRDTLAARKATSKTRQAARESTTAREPEAVNPRVWHMFKEAIDFKTGTVTPLQTALSDLESSTLEFWEGVMPLLRAPLPRVWQAVEGGLAEPLRATASHNHPHIAGGDMDDTALRMAVQDFEARLQLKVRYPLAQWCDALETVRERFPELERLRGRLERRIGKIQRQEDKAERASRHRLGVKRGARGIAVRGRSSATRHTGLRGMLFRCTHPRADEPRPVTRGPGGGELGAGEGEYSDTGRGEDRREEAGLAEEELEAREEFKREELDMRLKDRHRKLNVARDDFLGEESLLHEQLSGLCRDSAWTKSYVAAGLLMAKELMQEGVVSLGSTLQPLPAVKTPDTSLLRGGVAAAPAGEEAGALGGAEEGALSEPVVGKLRSNLTYAAAMPEFATRARAHATLDDLKAAAARRLHAHKATATPLELHASPEARPGHRAGTTRGLMTPTERPTTASGHL